jgi:hypothetical protein
VREFYIGFEKSHSGSVSCIKVFRPNGYSLDCVSENNKRYWCHEPLFGYDVHILIDSPVGKKITEMIDKREDNEVVGEYLTKLVLNRIESEDVVELIKEKCDAAYDVGYHDAQKDMRKAMGFH